MADAHGRSAGLAGGARRSDVGLENGTNAINVVVGTMMEAVEVAETLRDADGNPLVDWSRRGYGKDGPGTPKATWELHDREGNYGEGDVGYDPKTKKSYPHVKFRDYSRGKRDKGAKWGHIFFKDL